MLLPGTCNDLMLRAATHILSLKANLVSLAPDFSPVTNKTPIFLPSAALARRKRGNSHLQKNSALKSGANENQKLPAGFDRTCQTMRA